MGHKALCSASNAQVTEHYMPTRMGKAIPPRRTTPSAMQYLEIPVLHVDIYYIDLVPKVVFEYYYCATVNHATSSQRHVTDLLGWLLRGGCGALTLRAYSASAAAQEGAACHPGVPWARGRGDSCGAGRSLVGVSVQECPVVATTSSTRLAHVLARQQCARGCNENGRSAPTSLTRMALTMMAY